MMKALPVYVLTVLFPFELIIMSGMGSGRAQLQMRHTENTVVKSKISLILFLSFHNASTCHVRLEAKYIEHGKRNNSRNNDAKYKQLFIVDSNPVNDISLGF